MAVNAELKINEVTICLYCALPEVVEMQMEALKPVENKLKVHWNNRIDRHPEAYDSYSEMVNESIATSPTEWVVVINDRTVPTAEEFFKIIKLLKQGYAVATQWSVAYMGLSKEVFRRVGWFDQRYIGGGYEDDDWILRLHMANLAYYESHESTTDYSWKSPVRIQGGDMCKLSEPHFYTKWNHTLTEVVKVLPEEKYNKWDEMIGSYRTDISDTWKPWAYSKLGIGQNYPHTGESRTKWFMPLNRKGSPVGFFPTKMVRSEVKD